MSLIDAYGWEQLCPDENSNEDTKNNKQMKLYAARDKNTGKLVNDITNPSRKFWQRKGDCGKAIRSYNGGYTRARKGYDLELVEFKLVEVNKW